MNVKKFTAPTSREALRKVRDALGPDAVILSNRPVDGVVEILALDNDDVASLASPSPESEMAAPRPQLNHMDDLPQAAAPAARRCTRQERRVLMTPRLHAFEAPAEQAPRAPMARPAMPSFPDLDEPAPAPQTYANRRTRSRKRHPSTWPR
jgi:flagellar biosynthesis protein FlhF